VRGDLIVAQGTSPTAWKRLPLGPANRCLISNGADAVWNACLYTGFTPGSIPFVDDAGNLAQNIQRFTWDNASRRMSVGNNLGLTTLYVYDAAAVTGVTGLTVRAGQNQGFEPMQSWLTASGAEVAHVDATGTMAAQSLRASGSSTRAAWQEAGTTIDPSTRADGDSWYNSVQQARKGVAGNRVYTVPQVLCSNTGASTSSTTATRLGSCTFPGGFLQPGDRVDIRFDYSHEGTDTGFTIEVRWGGSLLVTRSAAAAELIVTGRAEAGIHSSGAQWSAQSWGSSLSFTASVGLAADPLGLPLPVDFLARMDAPTAETVTLRSFTVVRYPAQSNP
jgi:hypothetical protein